MDDRVIKFRVGVMVLSTIIIGGILLLLFGDTQSLARRSYTVFIHFNDAPGVTEGTPVRKSGILIGRVTGVRFAEQGGVIVECRIDNGVKLFHSEVPEVTGSLLGGDVVIQFVRRARTAPTEPMPPPAVPAAEPSPSDKQGSREVTSVLTAQKTGQPATPPSPDQEVQPGEYIEGTVAPSPMQFIADMQGDMNEAIKALSSAGTEVTKLAGNINKILEDNDSQINRIIGETEEAITTFQTAMNNVNDVIGDEKVRANFKEILDGMPKLLADSRDTITTIRTTVEGVDRNLRNLEGFTGPLGEHGDEIVARVDRSVARLDELLGIMSDFGRKLNSGQGTLGKLMSDQELYNSLNAAARNIECVTRELKPIISDVRVFSDRIARHPEILGVRGAIEKSPGTKWPLGGGGGQLK
jgi:phospholipid/cholesterol/gamma-HCH transport system substrate-binding protein